jgi:hypothetical protein
MKSGDFYEETSFYPLLSGGVIKYRATNIRLLPQSLLGNNIPLADIDRRE